MQGLFTATPFQPGIRKCQIIYAALLPVFFPAVSSRQGGAEPLANARGLVFSLRHITVFMLDSTVALFTRNYERCPPQELRSNRSSIVLGRDDDTRCKSQPVCLWSVRTREYTPPMACTSLHACLFSPSDPCDTNSHLTCQTAAALSFKSVLLKSDLSLYNSLPFFFWFYHLQ